MTREIPFFLKMEDMSIKEIVNLKKALDNNKKVGGVEFKAHIVMYMQVPESHNNFGPEFFKDMKDLKVDPYKGDWYPA